jgi:hypothetical protein
MITVLQTFLLFWKMKSAIYKGETDYKFRAYGREEVQNKKLEVMLAVSKDYTRAKWKDQHKSFISNK